MSKASFWRKSVQTFLEDDSVSFYLQRVSILLNHSHQCRKHYGCCLLIGHFITVLRANRWWSFDGLKIAMLSYSSSCKAHWDLSRMANFCRIPTQYWLLGINWSFWLVSSCSRHYWCSCKYLSVLSGLFIILPHRLQFFRSFFPVWRQRCQLPKTKISEMGNVMV